MDIQRIAAKYDSLQREVAAFGALLTKLDDSEHDLSFEKGDIFVNKCAIEESDGQSIICSGFVKFDKETNKITGMDLEKTSPDGEKTRYQYTDGARGSSILKKTDTIKQKADLESFPGGTPKLFYQEIQFIESDLSPEIEFRSEQVRREILDAASLVELLEGTNSDSDSSPHTVTVKSTQVFSPGGKSREFSGTIRKDPETSSYLSIELTESLNGETREYYYTPGSDFDFYKKSTSGSMESAQIFDKNGPKLVLFQEEHSITLPVKE